MTITKWAAASLCASVALSLSTVFASAELIKDKTLTIGSDLTYPPYAFMENNQPAGFDVDITKLLAKNMNLQAEYVDTRFPNLITGIRSFKFDLIASAMFINDERKKVLNFIPYAKTGVSMFVLQDSSFKPKKVEELCGKIVGSIRGNAWFPALTELSTNYCVKNKLPAIELKEYETDPQATLMLRSKTIDVQMSDASVVDSVVERFPNQFIVTNEELLFPVLLGFGISNANKDLSKDVYAALQTAQKDGSYEALLKAYDFYAPSKVDFDDFENNLK